MKMQMDAYQHFMSTMTHGTNPAPVDEPSDETRRDARDGTRREESVTPSTPPSVTTREVHASAAAHTLESTVIRRLQRQLAELRSAQPPAVSLDSPTPARDPLMAVRAQVDRDFFNQLPPVKSRESTDGHAGFPHFPLDDRRAG